MLGVYYNNVYIRTLAKKKIGADTPMFNVSVVSSDSGDLDMIYNVTIFGAFLFIVISCIILYFINV